MEDSALPSRAPLTPDEQKQLHHDLKGCVAAIESAFSFLTDPSKDFDAERLHAMGMKRLRELVDRLYF